MKRNGRPKPPLGSAEWAEPGIGRRHGPWRALPYGQAPGERTWRMWLGLDPCGRGPAVGVADLVWIRQAREWELRCAPWLGGRTVRIADPPGRDGVDWPMVVPGAVFDRAREMIACWAVEIVAEAAS